ncbi:diiron oxygenase [Micromonospora sp. NBRC 101691]|uniref:diiron oxygenase n=1 Tax=Micromonospora sp. NBRC 101691 TaxID=3032198 RepID=UPI0024A1982F|nr:diiron oxygenase [Micromonospora sp. NBRC 101691]GLY26200.1 hypothetical protein Misp04_59310 [Micromonospora sp. NBRC 101691]
MTSGFQEIAAQTADWIAQVHGGPVNQLVGREFAYPSIFGNWDRSASVRSRRVEPLDDLTRENLLFFPPELVPVCDHPLVVARGDETRRRLLVRALHHYLNFTSELESRTVIPAATDLVHTYSGLPLPDQARADACKIVTDEAWHAQFSRDLQTRIVECSGEPMLPMTSPMFIDRLDVIAEKIQPHIAAASRILFAIVSETLVSALLAQIPHDQRLPSMVRHSVAEHARDEGRHHAYFRIILRYFWSALTAAERRAVGPLIPSIIQAFLEPDYRASATSMASLGFSVDEIEAILSESFTPNRVLSDVAVAARTTTRYFAEVGAMKDPATKDAFDLLVER